MSLLLDKQLLYMKETIIYVLTREELTLGYRGKVEHCQQG